MKKIMFNDKYGLTQAVLEGRKTMTRRVAYCGNLKKPNVCYGLEGKYEDNCILCDGNKIIAVSAYKVGEVVAIAQSYDVVDDILPYRMWSIETYRQIQNTSGWKNKMFVKADLMPHHIRIISIRIEHLQDIDDYDCLREGIEKQNCYIEELKKGFYHYSPRKTFAYLIDKVSRKGTWDSNPLVFVYKFELIN